MTKTAQHSFLFRLWIKFRGLLAILIVLFGVIVGLISLILPNEELYKDYVVEFLSKQWQKKVEIQRISGKWKGFGPKFIIDGLTIKGDDEVVVQQATLNINVFKYFIPKGATGISLGVSDVEVDFERKSTGKIVLKNKNSKKQSFSKNLEKLLSSGSISVNNLTLNLNDSLSQTQHHISSKIMVQQNDESRAFVLEVDSKDLAEKIVFKSITSKQYDFMQQANWYIEADNLSLFNLKKLINNDYIPNAFVDINVWADTKNGNISKLIAQGNLKNKLFTDDADITGFAELIYKGEKRNWNAVLNIKDIETNTFSQDEVTIHLSRHNDTIKLKADTLDIPLLKSFTEILGIANKDFYNLDLKGKLSNVVIEYDVKLRRIIVADLQFQELDYTSDDVNLTNLDGEIGFHNEQIRLLVDSINGSAVIPAIMRGKIEWKDLLLTAQTSMHDEDLDVKINSLWCDCNDFTIDGAARIGYDEGLLLDLTFAIYNAKVDQLYKYWPSVVWKPKVLDFLDKSLVSGVVKRGMIIYHGFKSEYPFLGNEGVFLTQSSLQSATVKYHKDWPAINDFKALVSTINTSLFVDSKQGKVLGAEINNVKAVINNFKKPFLSLTAYSQGRDNFLLDILKKSPLKKGLEILKQDISLTGFQKVKLNLDFPLNKPNVKVDLKGDVRFYDTDFTMGRFQLNQLNGVLDFQDFSLKLNNIKSKFLNKNVTVSGAIINHPDRKTSIDVRIKGDYDIIDFEPLLGIELPAFGNSTWDFEISNVGSSDDTKFQAFSNLKGTHLNIPEPFAKPMEKQTPFTISCVLPCINSNWDMNYDNKLTTKFQFNNESNEFQLNKLVFDHSDKDFGGQIDVLDVDKWISILAKNHTVSDKNSLPFKQMSLHINTLIFMARELKDVELNVEKSKDGIELSLIADDIKGSVTIANKLARKGVIVQLEKLHWQAPDIDKVQQSSSQVTNNYPPLHIWIGDFVYDGIPLGEASIEVRPIANGVRIEKFVTASELLTLNINGSWDRNQGKNGLSQFNIIMTSKDIAKFLVNLGFQAPISKADTLVNMQAQWNDFPSQFEIKNISGKMRIEIGQGDVVDANPGMGRVLGLFSLTNLPRRLILDFRDVVGKGLHFSSMQGDFVLDNGDAFTKSFNIDSSSAKIIISGKTGLSNQDYDQIITVEPRVGRVLPTIGAIAGGAVGAAAGFFVQGIFHKGLKDVGKIIYKVTGSWDNPVIEVLETKKLNEK